MAHIEERLAMFWSPSRHITFEGDWWQPAIMTILLAAARFQPTLPEELWHTLILSFFQQRDCYPF